MARVVYPMSEYIEIEIEPSDDGKQIFFYTNLRLSEGDVEEYDSRTSLERGSPVAQALAMIDGIDLIRIEGSDMVISIEPDVEWYFVVEEVSAALKDFFL
jgi:hypothetical protein